MKKSLKTVLSLILTAAMLLTVMLPAFAATAKAADNKVRFNIEKVENGPEKLRAGRTAEAEAEQMQLKDSVRVSIVLSDKATLENGFSTKGIASNKQAMSYRKTLQLKQEALAEQISREILGGKKLNVKWNLTLAANIISAEVPAIAVAAIERLDGVKKVVYERQYEPAVAETDVAEPNMATAGIMTGATAAWGEGYTGAGSKIAIIDTGIDTDHISFDADAFDYALADSDADLLTAQEVADVYANLQIATYLPDAAADAYISTKIPFALNYVDGNTDVTHDNDTQSEHGSHVAGIAAANRFIKQGDSYANAIEAVHTQGVAPDAQLLVMKVFGKGGGAYDSDYFAAIEDAVMLGADAINLSLGSAAAGFATDDTYQSILDSFQNYSDTVVSISAGNAGTWADATDLGVMLGEDNNFDTVGSPGSFANAFTVASVDNDGSSGPYFTADGKILYYAETYDNAYHNAAFVTLAGEQEFIYVDAPGTPADFAPYADLIAGKIAICNRGSTSFFEKANAAVEAGAIGVIIVNNQPGTISMNLSGYLYTAPAVSITQDDGAYLKSIAEAVKDEEGNVLYYKGAITVSGDALTTPADENLQYHTMSSFSSFGVPGDLSLKPEITAPGGNIYSVNGLLEGGLYYENMSGTSMAAPHIAGLSAVLMQYIRENGLVEKTGLTARQLTQSLLMSTAEAMLDGDGYYYPVFQQGAGLADISAAINSKSVIMMDTDTWDYAADGKVKIELGEDAARTGAYAAKFTVTNFSDETVEYALSGDFFTQYIHTYYGPAVRDASTDFIDAYIYWNVNGEDIDVYSTLGIFDFNGDGFFNELDVQYLLDYITGKETEIYNKDYADFDVDGDIDTFDAFQLLSYFNSAKVTAAPGETLEITAEIYLGSMIDNYDLNGNYVEGYLNVAEADSADGAIGVTHSIPVFGYYGNYTEASMTDRVDLLEYSYGDDPYGPYVNYAQGFLVRFAGDNNTYIFGGNPILDDGMYLPERNAINGENGDAILGSQNTLIRNIAGSRFTVTDAEGNDLMAPVYGGAKYGAYYSSSQGAWQNTSTQTAAKYVPSGLADGDEITLNVTFAPEYYVKADGSIDWDALGAGATTSMTATIDNTAPELVDAAVIGYDADTFDWDEFEITAKDNQYISAIAVFNDAGDVLYIGYPDPEAAKGEEMIVTLNHEAIQEELALDKQTKLLVQVYDYAANVTNYKLNLDTDDLTNEITVTADEALVLVVNNSAKINYVVEPWGVDESVTFTSSDETVATVDANGIVTGVADGECEITVASVLDPNATAVVYVLVKTISVDLNAVLWDEHGEVWLTAFNTATIPAYTKLTESLNKRIASITYGFDGTLYAATFDDDAWASDLYTVDPENFTFSLVGSSELGFMDLCPACAIGTEYLYAAYGPYILIIEAATGDYLGYFDMSPYTGGNYLVGIAYEEFYPYTSSIYYDFLFFVDEAGTLYEVGINNNFGRTAAYEVGNFGYETDMPYFNSLYYNGESVFWSRFNYADGYVDIIDWDASDTEQIFNLGSFDPDVWPVSGLFELETAEPDTADDPGARGEIEAIGDMLTSLEPIAPTAVAAGKLNADEGTASGDVNLPEGAFKQTVEIKAAEDACNGLVTVAYDAAKFTFAGLRTNAEFSSYTVDEEKGEVTFAYTVRAENAYSADDVIATVFFATEGTEDGTYTLTTEEINDTHPETEETVTATNEHVYAEPVWTWTKTETGYDAAASFACLAHGESEAPTVVPAAVERTEVIEPTCTKNGSFTYTATAEFNGKTYTDTKTVTGDPKTGHIWDEGAVKTAPTCVKGGVMIYTCTKCDATKPVTLPPTGVHDPVAVEAKDPTCTEPGNTAYYECSMCGKKFADAEGQEALTADVTIAALGHSFTNYVSQNDATCTEDGTKTAKCDRCDATNTIADVGSKLGHNLTDKETPATWVTNGKTYKECSRCGAKIDEKATDTKLHQAIAAANDWAAEKGFDAIIAGSDTNGADNTAVIELNVDGIWADPEINSDAFDGFMTRFGQIVTEYFGTDDVTINGNAVYKDGKFQNHAVKMALFDLGAGFFSKLANLGDDGVYGTYNVTIDGEAIALTVKFTGSNENLEKIKSFAATIAEHVSADTSGENLVIDVIAPEQLIATIANEYQGDLPVAEALKEVGLYGGLSILAMKDAESVFGSQVSAVNKLCAFLCKLNPLVNKVFEKITDATVTLADGSNVNLIDSAFAPEGEYGYTAFLNAVIAAMDDALLEKTVGDFTEEDGVYTIPVNVTVDMGNLGLMSGSTIEETVIIRLHLFDNCKHSDIVTQPGKEATCTEDGITEGSYCRICGEVFAAQETIPAAGHKMTKTEAASASCTADGNVEYYTCSVCGKIFADADGKTELTETVIPATGHAMTKTDYKAATCTAAGNVAYYTCSNCGKIFADAAGNSELTDTVIPATGHAMTKTAAKAATCTAAGNVEYYTCSNCGKTFADAAGKTELKSTAIPATGHKMTKTAAKAATCTKAGNVEYYTCSNCGKTFADAAGKTELKTTVVSATGHNMTKVKAKAATCTEDGNVTYYICANCGKIFADKAGKTELKDTVTPATGHKMTKVKAKAATCTEAGNVTYYKCANCGKTFADKAGKTELKKTVVPATGHSMTKTAAKAATCTEAGNVAYYTCANCGKTFADKAGKTELTDTAVPAKGHTLKKVAAKAATETKEGNITYYKCTVCGKLFVKSALGMVQVKPKDVVIPKLNPTKLGDVNRNNKIDLEDARMALRIALDLDTYAADSWEMRAANVNGKAGVDLDDAREILRVALGLDTPDWAAWYTKK